MTHKFDSSYAFTSFSGTFIIIYGDEKGTNIGCVSATATPDLGGLKWLLKVAPVVVLLLVGFATIFAGIFSPWGSTDVFHWTSNYGRDTPAAASCHARIWRLPAVHPVYSADGWSITKLPWILPADRQPGLMGVADVQRELR